MMYLKKLFASLLSSRQQESFDENDRRLFCEPLESRQMLATFGGYEYVLTEPNLTWDEAQADAAAKGGWLVIIDSQAENDFLVESFGNENYYIGLTDADSEGEFRWTSGVLPDYTNFAPWEPNNWENREDHAVINGESGFWFDWDGSVAGIGIVEIPPTETFEFNNATYRLTPDGMTWDQADAFAQSVGGELVKIENQAENDWLTATFGSEFYFIGANDVSSEGDFVWSDGSPIDYQNWSPGEPNNWENREDHAVIYGATGAWFDWDGRAAGRGIVEIKNGPTNPGQIALETSVISVVEGAATVDVKVRRTGGSDGAVSVDYQTVAITAEDGDDYQGKSGVLQFADGETEKSIEIAILDNGIAEPYQTFSLTIDNVGGGATLLAPRTATITIKDDDVVIPQFSDFTGATGVQFNGDTTVVGNRLQLTEARNWQAGSAFGAVPIPIDEFSSFQVEFQFQISGGDGPNGADGIALVLQNSQDGAAALGNNGSGIGFEGIDKSLAIEFDTYQNTGEINANHVSVVANGNQFSPLATNAYSGDLNGGTAIRAWIEYNGNTNLLAVYVANDDQKPASPLMTTSVDLAAVVGNQMFVGFAGATGGKNNAQQILDLSFSSEVPEPPSGPNPGDQVVNESLVTGLIQPTAIDWAADGSVMYVAQQNGVVYFYQNGVLGATPFIDISNHVNGTRDRGLLDIAVHPDFENHPYVYLLYTYDPPEVYDNASHPLAGPDKNGNRAGRLTRVTADVASGYTRAVPGSEVVLLGGNSTWGNFNGFVNSTIDFDEPAAGVLPDGSYLQDFIPSDSESHSVGGLAFGIDGELFVSTGDGASYNRVDPRAVRVQHIDSLSGKVLRIDPLTGEGLSDNPFYDGNPNSNRSKVYQLGLRNPFRISVDSLTGELYVGDVGWTRWEEINAGAPGANFGWPYYEGGVGSNVKTPGYQDLPEAQAFYSSTATATPAVFALNHSADGINAIILGDVYRSSAYPSDYFGGLFFNDLGQGIVRYATFDESGNLSSVQTFTTGARIVVQITVGPDGNLYYVDLDDGTIGRWLVV